MEAEKSFFYSYFYLFLFWTELFKKEKANFCEKLQAARIKPRLSRPSSPLNPAFSS